MGAAMSHAVVLVVIASAAFSFCLGFFLGMVLSDRPGRSHK